MQSDFRIQLKKHFREAVYPHGVTIEPLPGETLVVLDRHLRLLPVGIPGTLYLGGIAPEVAGDLTRWSTGRSISCTRCRSFAPISSGRIAATARSS